MKLRNISLLWILLLFGCSTLSSFFSSNEGHMTTQIAVIELIQKSHDPAAMAAKLKKEVADLREGLIKIPTLSLSDIDKDLRNEIITGDLDPVAKPLANQLLTSIEQKLQLQLNVTDLVNSIAPITDAQRVVINGVFTDIETAIKMAGY